MKVQHFGRAVGALAFSIALSACGARTGLEEWGLVGDAAVPSMLDGFGVDGATTIDGQSGDATPQSASVSAVCQCGMCSDQPFCVSTSTGQFARWGRDCESSGSLRSAAPVDAVLSSGAVRTLFCDGPPADACEPSATRTTLRPEQRTRLTGGGTLPTYVTDYLPDPNYPNVNRLTVPDEWRDYHSPCYFTNDELRARGVTEPRLISWANTMRRFYCPQTMAAPFPLPARGLCSQVDSRSLPNTPFPGDAGLMIGSTVRREWAQNQSNLLCPKIALQPNQQICTLGMSNWTDQQFIVSSAMSQAQYCSLLGPSGNWSRPLGSGSGSTSPQLRVTARRVTLRDVFVENVELPAQICFARIGCNSPSRVQRSACLPQANNATDPGDMNSGRRYANTAADTTSTVRVASLLDPTVSVEVPVDVTASIDTSFEGRALLTDLSITQRVPQTWSGHSISGTLGRIEDTWAAQYDSASSQYPDASPLVAA
jgi:hypothetical protein